MKKRYQIQQRIKLDSAHPIADDIVEASSFKNALKKVGARDAKQWYAFGCIRRYQGIGMYFDIWPYKAEDHI